MATAAVAMPTQAFSHHEPTQILKAQPKDDFTYTDPSTAPKTKVSQGCPLAKLTPKAPGPNQLYKQKGVSYGDWRDDLVRDGFVVVKGVSLRPGPTIPKHELTPPGNHQGTSSPVCRFHL